MSVLTTSTGRNCRKLERRLGKLMMRWTQSDRCAASAFHIPLIIVVIQSDIALRLLLYPRRGGGREAAAACPAL